MNHSALLTLFRSITRHKLYAALNIGGLAVGIAVFLVLGLYVRFETSYERWIPNHQQVYIAIGKWNLPGVLEGPTTFTMGGMLEQLKGDYPGLVGTRIVSPNTTVLHNDIGSSENIGLVDPNFFDVFQIPMLRGNAYNSLNDPTGVLIDQKIADKYYPGVDAVGKQMTLTVAGSTQVYRVSGIFKDLPENTTLKFDILAKLVPSRLNDPSWYSWGMISVYTYLRFPTAADAKILDGRLDDFIRRHGARDLGPNPLTQLHMSLIPIADVRFLGKGARLTVVTLGIVGLLTLLIAIVNYVNLATARAGLRAREVAMRKVLGADRRALIRQFIGEALATTAIATLIGIAIAEISLPLVNAASGLSLSIPYASLVPPMMILILFVGFCAGFYPAVVLSRFQAAAVLASSRSPGGGRSGTRVREILVVLQFALAIAFITGTLVLVAQTRHVRQTDLGYQRDDLLIIPATASDSISASRLAEIVTAFKAVPGVSGVTTADNAPGDPPGGIFNAFGMRGSSGDGPLLQEIQTGPDFLRVLGARQLAGRDFDNAHADDDVTNRPFSALRNIIVNQTGAAALGFANPQEAIGKTVGTKFPRTIIGVVDDMRFYSPRDALRPTYFEYQPRSPARAITILRFTGDQQAVLSAVRTAWRRIAPEVPFDAVTGNQRLAGYYEADEHAAHLFTIGAGLAVIIGCVGLWGLASFNTARRVKEIGIRKTLGASSADIVKLLVGQFLRPVLIANLIAWPLAWFTLHAWLTGFDDRISLSPFYFVTATALAIVIAVITVLAQSLRAARATPAWALRHE